MSKLDTAIDRFGKALDRLEAAIVRRSQSVREAPLAQREVQALRDDRVRLAGELDAVKADYAALESVSDEVEVRLDGAIREIQRVLEG